MRAGLFESARYIPREGGVGRQVGFLERQNILQQAWQVALHWSHRERCRPEPRCRPISVGLVEVSPLRMEASPLG